MANKSTTVQPEQLKINDYIRFRVISIKDTSIYTGKVIGICGFETARMYNSDIVAQHLLMQQGFTLRNESKNNDMLDIREQTFIVVHCMDGIDRPFAFEWLMTQDESWKYVELIEKGLVYNIRLYDVTASEAANAAEILRNSGYTLKIVSIEEQ